MTRTLRYIGVALLLVVLVAAAPTTSIEDLVRQGNAAATGKKYTVAVKFYEQAEERALDPGLVAYNKGVALYSQAQVDKERPQRLAHFKQAADAYRCATEGADGLRLVRAHFGLGNSLVQGRPDEVSALQESMASYRICMNSDLLDEETRKDARNNLEIAKLMLLRAKATKSDEEPKHKEDGPDPKPKDRKDDDKKDPKDNSKDSKPDDAKPKKTDEKVGIEKDGKPRPKDKQETGTGEGKALFDPKETPPISRAAAEAELNEAMNAIRNAIRDKQIRISSLPNGSVKDW